jgi:hypothetical protein
MLSSFCFWIVIFPFFSLFLFICLFILHHLIFWIILLHFYSRLNRFFPWRRCPFWPNNLQPHVYKNNYRANNPTKRRWIAQADTYTFHNIFTPQIANLYDRVSASSRNLITDFPPNLRNWGGGLRFAAVIEVI